MKMSRPLRLALDIALGSVTKARPVISNAWDSTKDYVLKTRAKRLVCNNFVYKLEEKMNVFTELLIMKMTTLRNNQLPKEAQYLQRELETVMQRLQKEGASKTLKEKGAMSWRYLKVEAVPPLTVGIFNGPFGDKLDAGAENIMDTIINALAGKIKAIDEKEARLIKEKEAAIKAEQERQIAEAKKKAEEKKAAEYEAKMAAAKAAADAAAAAKTAPATGDAKAAPAAKDAKAAPAAGSVKSGTASGAAKSGSEASKPKNTEKKTKPKPETKPKSK